MRKSIVKLLCLSQFTTIFVIQLVGVSYAQDYPSKNYQALEKLMKSKKPFDDATSKILVNEWQACLAVQRDGKYADAMLKAESLNNELKKHGVNYEFLDRYIKYIDTLVKKPAHVQKYLHIYETDASIFMQTKRADLPVRLKEIETLEENLVRNKLADNAIFTQVLHTHITMLMQQGEYRKANELALKALKIDGELFGETSPLSLNSYWFALQTTLLVEREIDYQEITRFVERLHRDLTIFHGNYLPIPTSFYFRHFYSGIVNDFDGLDLAFEFAEKYVDKVPLYSFCDRLSIQNLSVSSPIELKLYLDRGAAQSKFIRSNNPGTNPLLEQYLPGYFEEYAKRDFFRCAIIRKTLSEKIESSRTIAQKNDLLFDESNYYNCCLGLDVAERDNNKSLIDFFSQELVKFHKSNFRENVTIHPLLVIKLSDGGFYELSDEKKKELNNYLLAVPKLKAKYEKYRPFAIK